MELVLTFPTGNQTGSVIASACIVQFILFSSGGFVFGCFQSSDMAIIRTSHKLLSGSVC